MRTIFSSFIVSMILIACTDKQSLIAQSPTAINTDDFNLQFDLPKDWNTEIGHDDGEPFLVSSSPNESIELFAFEYQNGEDSIVTLFERAVDRLELQIEGEVVRRSLGGFEALIGFGAGEFPKEKIGFVLMVAASNSGNYFSCLITPYEEFKSNRLLMNRIIGSIALTENQSNS